MMEHRPFEELKEQVDKMARTDHLTLPNVPEAIDEEEYERAEREREMVLNPSLPENRERRARHAGFIAKENDPHAKHEIVMEDGEVVVKSPEREIKETAEVDVRTISEVVDIKKDASGQPKPVIKEVINTINKEVTQPEPTFNPSPKGVKYDSEK